MNLPARNHLIRPRPSLTGFTPTCVEGGRSFPSIPKAVRRRRWLSWKCLYDQAAAKFKSPTNLTKEMVVSNEFFTACATWRRLDNVWACIYADEPLRWMLPLTKDAAKLELLRRGCHWSWSNSPPTANSKVGIAAPVCKTAGASRQTKYEAATTAALPRYPLQDSASGDGSRGGQQPVAPTAPESASP